MIMNKDVTDYVRRLFLSTFFCPVAAAFWVLFAWSGFDLDSLFSLAGSALEYYSNLDSDAQASFQLEVYGVWGVVSFGFMFLSFALNPPRFHYKLDKQGDHWITHVVDR